MNYLKTNLMYLTEGMREMQEASRDVPPINTIDVFIPVNVNQSINQTHAHTHTHTRTHTPTHTLHPYAQQIGLQLARTTSKE